MLRSPNDVSKAEPVVSFQILAHLAVRSIAPALTAIASRASCPCRPRSPPVCRVCTILSAPGGGGCPRGVRVPCHFCFCGGDAAMADPAETKVDGDTAVAPDGRSTDERAAVKAKINSIWEKLNGKDSLPVKVGLPKVQKASSKSSSKPSKAVPSWMVDLGLAPPKGSAIHKPGQAQSDKLPKVANGDASNGALKDSQITGNQEQVEVKESRKSPQTDLKVNELLSRLREGADTTTNSHSKASEDSKDSKAAQALRRKSEMQASSSSGLDNLLQQISKKQKPNILDRTRKDWGQFKEEKGLEDELEAYKKSGDKYLDKVAFLQRSDLREYEKERDARLALQSKRQSETAPLN